MANKQCEYWIHEEVKWDCDYYQDEVEDLSSYRYWLRTIEPQDMWKYETPCSQCELCMKNEKMLEGRKIPGWEVREKDERIKKDREERNERLRLHEEKKLAEIIRKNPMYVPTEKSGWYFEEKK